MNSFAFPFSTALLLLWLACPAQGWQVGTAPDPVTTTAAQKQPNIIVIVSDDAGYADFSFQGSAEIPTPRIDSIADGGARFEQAYVTCSVCSPSRAGLITGRYQQRFGHETNILPKVDSSMGLPVGERTIADYLQAGGYRTFALGKWHLGYEKRFHPLARGFDGFFGFLQGHRSFFPIDKGRNGFNQLLRDRKPIEEDFEYMTDELGAQAAAYIAASADKPFFLYVAFNAVHTPLHTLPEDLKRFQHLKPGRRNKMAAMTVALDRAVGHILDQLDKQQIRDQTLIIFINDNGGKPNAGSSNAPLRGKKRTPFEGGLRVPCAMQWTGHIPAGQSFEAPVSSLDILPTALAAASLNPKLAHPLDGVNLLPFLSGEQSSRPHQTLYWRHNDNYAIRDGDWKLLENLDQGPMLFDLKKDPGESKNLIEEESERHAALLAKFKQWETGLIDPLWIYGNAPKKQAKD